VPRSEPSIDLTLEELLHLSEITSLPLPAGIDEGIIDGIPDGYRAYIRDLADRTLRVREIVADGDDGEEGPPIVAPAVYSILETAGEAGLMGVVSVEGDGIVDTRFFTARPELAVELEAIAPSVHRFVPFMPRDFLARILRFTDLRPSEVAPVDPIRVSIDALESAAGLARSGDTLESIAALQGAGVSELAARALNNALITPRNGDRHPADTPQPRPGRRRHAHVARRRHQGQLDTRAPRRRNGWPARD
jgi:hypothetical protein